MTPQQRRAIDRINRWRRNGHRQVFRMFGYAGTGKTTLAQHFVEDRVLFAAFTGKAALVLKSKGCENARTLHSLIYKPAGQRRREIDELWKAMKGATPQERVKLRDRIRQLEKPGWVLNPESPLAAASLLVVDEVSMVNKTMAEHILSFGVKVLVIGDPAQLPPVTGEGYFIAAQPDVLLTEVHRNAADSPVLEWATNVRRSGAHVRFRAREGTGVYRRRADEPLPVERLLKYDQIIVGRNGTRYTVNYRVRKHLGRPSNCPVVGDRVMCLQNNSTLGVINGQQFIVRKVTGGDDDFVMDLENCDTGATIKRLPVWREGFKNQGGTETLDSKAGNFTFAYAITCHKAQGSQWGSVAVVDESSLVPGDPSRWLYTAITRAEHRVVVIRSREG